MDDEEVMELAEKFWLEFKSRIEIPESVSEKDADELFKVLRMTWKIAFFTGYNICEEKENPTLAFAKTTLRDIFKGGKINF